MTRTRSIPMLSGKRFAVYLDEALTLPTAYDESNNYFIKARDRINRTFEVIEPYVKNQVIVDVGASPFYLLYRAKLAGARRCYGMYFSNDSHPLRDADVIYSDAGAIEINHANVEEEKLPFEADAVDMVSACEILEHLDFFPAHFAAEVRRVIRPGGYLLITVPNVCSVANIVKLLLQRNIYNKYRSDPSGRHKHEYTHSELLDLISYMGMDVVESGFMATPTSEKFALRPFYNFISKVPVLRRYSPALYVLARQRSPKSTSDLKNFPDSLFTKSSAIES